jgi:hypothetical protein
LTLAISGLTGLSQPVVSHSISVEQHNSGRKDILAAMDRDLGDHHILDTFIYNEYLGDKTRGFGPSLVGAVLTANVPGLSYLPMVRSLMVKAPLIAKLASDEPLFGPAWLKSVEQIEPALGRCVALCHWHGGNEQLENVMFAPCETIILYGGEQTIRALRARIGPHKKIIEHGHRIGMIMVAGESLANREQAGDLARRIALDTAVFDQRACIAPQIIYVEKGGKVEISSFCALIEEQLLCLETTLPPAAMSVDTGASLAMERNLAGFKAANQSDFHLFARGAATIILDPDPTFSSVLPTRFLRVCPVQSLADVLDLVKPFGRYLQNVGLETNEQKRYELAEMLGKLGASRITRPGLMHKPSMRWKHDGLSSFSELVRWVDIEIS